MTAKSKLAAAAALVALISLPLARPSMAADEKKESKPAAAAAVAPKPFDVQAGPGANTLTEEEKKAGWKLLFDGKSLDGWHNFKATTVKPGWQVKDGALICENPKNAGDILTPDKYSWFE